MALQLRSLAALVKFSSDISAASRKLMALTALAVLAIAPAIAQTNPTPNTFSTLAGGYATTYTAGGVCGGATSGSKYIAVDALGNGCPLTQAILGPSLSGIGVDGAGNIFVQDYSNGQVRRIDARSGIVSKVIGTNNTVCSATPSATGTKQDAIGSGCVNTSALGATSPRGLNVDPWGNVIIGSYSSSLINVICLTASPLCPNTAGRKQVGSFYRVAGCIPSQGGSTTAASGIVAYSSGDNSPASPYQNLAGDVAAWGLTGAAATAATVGATGNTCTAASGAVNQARNAQADKYGNVYIADTNGQRYRVVLGPASYKGVTNPLFAIINMNPQYTATEGFIYTILGAFSSFTANGITYNVPTAAGGACSSASSTVVATDTLGDGCSFFETGKPVASNGPAGLGVDKDGNPIFSDTQDNAVRIMYVGGAAMAHIISVNNGGITPVVGTVYAIEGTGTLSKSATPVLDISAGNLSTSNTKVAVDAADNIYLSDGVGVSIIDSATGYLRRNFNTGGATCATGVNGNGDGCPAGQGTAYTSLSSVGTAITVDNLGNLLLADSTGRVRKVLAGTLYPTAVGSTFTQNIVLHEPAGTTGITATLLHAPSGITIPSTAPTCVLYTTASDNTADCTIPVTFAPTFPGKVGAVLSVTNIGGGGATTLYPLVGQATGAALVTDVAAPTTSIVTTAIATPTSLAFDTGGNLYTVDNSTFGGVYRNGTSISSTVPANPNQVAVDPSGNVYVTSTGSASINVYTLGTTGTYTVSTVTNPAIALPQGIAFDQQGNMYVSDATTVSVYEIPNNAGYASLQSPVAIATGLSSPTLLTIDGSGNVLIADTGIVYRVNASTGALTTVASASAGGVVLSALTPVGIAADAGDNVYIQDSASKNIFEIPYQTYAPGAITVLTGEVTPHGLAVDGRGQIYAADRGATPSPAIISVQRASETFTFPTPTSTYTGIFTNTGNASSTGYLQTDSAEFPYTGTGSGGCGTISGTSPLATGGACNFSVTPNLGGNGQLVSNTTTLIPATSIGSLTLTAQEPQGVTYSTTTTVAVAGGGSSSAVYKSSGAEITFTISESSTNNNSQNGENINVTIDSGNPVVYVLSGGTATVPVSGLTSGSHTISAVYPGDGTYLTSNGSANFTITQAATTVAWTPAISSAPYSTALGTGLLNATATSSSLSVPGSFIYTATPASGPAVFVHSASYLPIGTYTLGVTFVPNDALDYAQSTSTANFSVTKASTTAALGTTQTLVAADNTGNYTSVQAAVNAVGSTGGSIYIAPGTYSGPIAVVQPNVSMRGLGGDPTKVILTNRAGAFGGSGVNSYGGEFTSAQNNGAQLPAGSTLFTGDEASATLVVAKGINTALSPSNLIPNNFYGENFTLVNTYDSDNVSTTSSYLPASQSGTCAVQGTPRTFNDLFNSGLLCAPQALAIWTTSDLAVMNNIVTTSLQDTIYTASQGNSIPARQYWFRGKVTGDIDFIFGDSASVFDNTSIYTVWHGATATGTETIHAQNKAAQTGGPGDYLSGYVMNSDVFTSQSTGMTNLYLGRPYGTYSTWIMLNAYIDQVNPTGYTTGLGPTLIPVTFSEYNDLPYTDPATGSPDRNGVPYLGTGGNTGTGVTGPREASSTNPGTPMANDAPPTAMTQAQAQAFFPTNFLSQTVAGSPTTNWNPTAAIASAVNAFVPSGTTATIAGGTSVTILMRPQTPGLGAITNNSYTIPTGTYTLSDTFNGGNPTVIASGTLDAAGEAYFTSSSLTAGTHNLSWTYSGDANFSGSTTASAYVLTITGPAPSATTTTLNITTPITYGSSAPVSVTVASTGGTPTGTVTLTINGTTNLTAQLSGGVANFAIPGLTAATYSITASYSGATAFTSSATNSPSPLVVNKLAITLTGTCASRLFGTPNVCSAAVTPGYAYTDSAATVFTSTPTATPTGGRYSPVGSYSATPVYTLSAFGSTNYTVTPVNGSFNITGGAAQSVIFPPLPNFHAGTYQLTARSTSGLPVTYTVTTGNGIASINGKALIVTGTGPVTVQATQTDPTGDYATAGASAGFTAQ